MMLMMGICSKDVRLFVLVAVLTEHLQMSEIIYCIYATITQLCSILL